MDGIFSDYNLGLRHIYNPYDFTFKLRYYDEQENTYQKIEHDLDHIWASRELSVSEPLDVYEVCNLGDSWEENERVSLYNHRISDHCPITVSFQW
jgi:hypothetical protein